MNATAVCSNCKKVFPTFKNYEKRNTKNRFCCKKCEAEFRNLHNSVESWKGGHVSKSNGYKYIMFNGKQIEEHRLVMMKSLGRELSSNEIVHHINGDRQDNRIENLQLLSRAEHQKLHHSKPEVACKKCGRIKKIHARGLCNSCYSCAFVKGEIAKYAKVQK